MEKSSVEAIVCALNEAGVRYLIVGGMAVVAHGYLRFTADLDLVLDLREGNLDRAVSALAGQGYRPRAPVPLEDFVDAEKQGGSGQGETVDRVFLGQPETPKDRGGSVRGSASTSTSSMRKLRRWSCAPVCRRRSSVTTRCSK